MVATASTMKQLRILTGQHAGVRLHLGPDRYRLAADPQSTVQISDWTGVPGLLEITANGARWSEEGGALESVPDFELRYSGSIVWCVGPAMDDAWPADIELLKGLMKTPAIASAPLSKRLLQHPRTSWWVVVVTVAIALTGMGASVAGRSREALTSDSNKHSSMSQGRKADRQIVERLLSQQGVWRPTVTTSAEGLAVGGLVPTETSAAVLRQQLEELGVGSVQFNVISAAAISSQMAEGIGQPGAQVEYLGEGKFRVGGTLNDSKQARVVAGRLSSDFGNLVERIEFSYADLGSAEGVPLRASLHVEDFEYVQTRDGSKHLLIGDRSNYREHSSRETEALPGEMKK